MEYRGYIVDVDGHFIGFEPLICWDDAEAVAKTRGMIDGHDVELWCGERLVKRLEGKQAK